MILIYPECLSVVTADSESGSFPATNLQDDRPKKYWMSGGSNVATLTATVAADSDQIAIFNTNAASAVITIKLAGVEQESFIIDLTSPHTHNRLWQSYTEQTAVHTVEIQLTTTVGSAVYAGVMRIGKGVTVSNPAYGISESRRDFSIVRELNNGAYYIRKRDSVRTFSLSFTDDRATDFYNFTEVMDYYGPEPIAVLLAEDVDSDPHEWAIFGHILTPFNGSHEYYSHTNVSFEITEAV